MKTPAEVLRATKALIPNEAHWWRGPKSGPRGKDCHCIITAVLACGGSYVMRFLDAVIGWPLSKWNDWAETTFEAIHAAFSAAIELAEAK